MADKDQDKAQEKEPLSKSTSPVPPEETPVSEWDAFSDPPSDGLVDWESQPVSDQPPKKGNNGHVLLLLAIILICLLIVFIGWVWVSDRFGIGIFGQKSSSSEPVSSSAVSEGLSLRCV